MKEWIVSSTCGNLVLIGTTAILAVGAMPTAGVFEYTVQYSALGILGWAVWYMLAKAFPRHLSEQRKERNALIEAHLEAQRNTRKEFQDALETILEVVRSSSES